MSVFYMYILLCSDGSLYTGYTDNLARRVRKHNSGQGAKYTKSRRPVRLLYWEKYASKQQAMQREWAVKQWKRAEKLRLLPVDAASLAERVRLAAAKKAATSEDVS